MHDRQEATDANRGRARQSSRAYSLDSKGWFLQASGGMRSALTEIVINRIPRRGPPGHGNRNARCCDFCDRN